jgi:DNA-binding NarL/FixJ family response regulator
MSQNQSGSGRRILVVENHEMHLYGMVLTLKQHYPIAEVLTAQTVQGALEQIAKYQPDLVILDLAVPEIEGGEDQIDTGIQLLRTLMRKYPTLNITVQSSFIKALVRIRPEVDGHGGGFTTVDKNLSTQDMLTRIDWALQGVTHTKDIKGVRAGLEVKPEWLVVLKLAFNEGLQDNAIAERMKVSLRTVRLYWTKIQDALGIYPEDSKENGKSLRIQTEIRAREAGLID